MMPTHEVVTLMEALKAIRRECLKHYRCDDCPMGSGKITCIVNEVTPEEWEIGLKDNVKVVRCSD